MRAVQDEPGIGVAVGVAGVTGEVKLEDLVHDWLKTKTVNRTDIPIHFDPRFIRPPGFAPVLITGFYWVISRIKLLEVSAT
jgi:hypothetical protein